MWCAEERAWGVAGAAFERPQRGERRIGACQKPRGGRLPPVQLSRKKEKKAPLRRWVGGLVARFGGLFGPIVFWVATA